MKNWFSRLLEPYPLELSWPSIGRSAGIALVVVTAFLYFLQPFGTSIPPGQELGFFAICLGYGVVAAVVLIGFCAALRAFVVEKNWTLGREILLQIGIVSTIGTANLFYAKALWGHLLTFSNWLEWQKMTALVAFAPIAVTAFFRQTSLKSRFENEAAELEKSRSEKVQLIENQPVSSKKIQLVGDNQGEKLEIDRADFLFIEAADNYVEVHFLKSEKPESRLLRGTLKKMEEQLEGHADWLRCHRAFLVDLSKIERVSGNAQGYKLHLFGAAEPIPVSRNLNALVAERLKNG